MRIRRIIIFCILCMMLIKCATTSSNYVPTKISTSGTYYHNPTQIEFPINYNNYIRDQITSFNQEQSNIAVNYINEVKGNREKLTVYIYPAGIGDSDRLYNEYIETLQSIAYVNKIEINAKQSPYYIKQDDYSFLGITATINNLPNNNKSKLTIFECGEYFLKLRLDTDDLNDEALEKSHKNLLLKFKPSDIVKKYPLLPKSNIHVAPVAFADSLTLYSILNGAFKKSDWALNNIDSLQRCSGFPGLYFECQYESFIAITKGWTENPKGFKKYNNEYIESLIKLTNNGYLDEFLMDEYNMLLYNTKEKEFEFNSFYRWKEKNLPNFSLVNKLFTIDYTR